MLPKPPDTILFKQGGERSELLGAAELYFPSCMRDLLICSEDYSINLIVNHVIYNDVMLIVCIPA